MFRSPPKLLLTEKHKLVFAKTVPWSFILVWDHSNSKLQVYVLYLLRSLQFAKFSNSDRRCSLSTSKWTEFQGWVASTIAITIMSTIFTSNLINTMTNAIHFLWLSLNHNEKMSTIYRDLMVWLGLFFTVCKFFKGLFDFLVCFGANDDVGYQLQCERCLYEYVRGCIGLDPLLVLFLSKHLQLFFR